MATQQVRLAELILSIGTDIKNILAKIGGGSLNTSSQNLVGAVNEVKATADAAVEGTAPDASTSVKGIAELATNAEVLALTDTVRIVTPAGLASILNVNNGIPKLDSSGKVGASQLPSYVDDTLEVANFAALPGTGETGKIYVTIDNNKTFRWTGSVYVEISASPGSTDAVTEGSTNLYYTDARADARANGRITALIGDPDTDLAALYATAKA